MVSGLRIASNMKWTQTVLIIKEDCEYSNGKQKTYSSQVGALQTWLQLETDIQPNQQVKAHLEEVKELFNCRLIQDWNKKLDIRFL